MTTEPKYREDDWDGPGKLKHHSTAAMEAAIGRALSELVGETLQVRIGAMDFGNGGIPAKPLEMTVSVSRPPSF